VSFQLEAISGKNRARKMLLHAGCILHSAFFIIAISCCIRGSPWPRPLANFTPLQRFSIAFPPLSTFGEGTVMKIQFEMRNQQTNWPRPLRDLQVGGGWNKWAANGMDWGRCQHQSQLCK